MARKPTYEELEQRIKELEREHAEAKTGEEDLHEIERIRQLLKSAPYGIFLIDLSGKIVAANNEGADRLEKTVEEIIGTTLREYFPQDVAENRRLKGIEVVKSGKSVIFEDHVGNIWYSNSIFPVLDNQGNMTHLAIYGTDITAFKLKEEALCESEEKYRSMMEAMSDPAYICTQDYRLDYMNPAMVKRTGRDATGELCHKAINDLDEPCPWCLHDNIKVVKPFEMEIVSPKDNRFYSVSSSPIYHRDGSISKITIFKDITDRKRAENALRESEARFRELADLLPQTVYEYDAQGNLTYVNSHAFNLFGYTVEDFEKGLNVFQMLIPEDQERAAKAIQSVLTGNPIGYDRQYRSRRKDGTSFPVEIYSSPIVRQGNIVGLRGILVDMSEHEKAEKEKKKLQIQLIQAQKMESVGRLAGGVAHDFNNMLGIIIGNIEMAMLTTGHGEPIYQFLREILKASQRSADLVRQLLAFARKQTVRPRVLDLNDTVSVMLKMLRRLIGENIDLAWMPGHDIWHVKIDPSQVDQILANLAVNARDAITGVGKITIETDSVTLDEAYCEVHPMFLPGQYVLLAVSDDGVGMSKEILEHLFEPFFTTKEMGKGTGLGLSSVYGAVKQNGGFINVYSEPNEGTTFKIYLPRFESKAIQTEREDKPESLQRGNETLLMVEDEAAILEIGKGMLGYLGYTVLTASKPREAISIAREHTAPIHLLFTDVVMPDMNGRELSEQLKLIHPDLKCLYMSGYTANAIAHHGILDEGVHFIHKPFMMKELAERVREALDEA